MKIFSISFFIVCFCFSVSAKGESATRKRYIVFNKNPNLISEHIKKKGRKALRQARNFSAVIAELNSNEIAELKKSVAGISLVEDATVQIAYDKNSVRIEALPNVKKNGQKPDWGYKLIRASLANKKSKGIGVRVCVVDTGVDKTHPDLAENIVGGKNFTTDDPNAWQDNLGHGTHVAGIIAAASNRLGVVGVAPKAEIYVIKAIGDSGYGYLSNIADGVLECIKIGAKVINMSLAGGKPVDYDPMAAAVQTAIDSGIKVVVAAGNSAQDIANFVPASYPGVIAVGAIQLQGARKIVLTSFSNIGLSAKDYVAPGLNIRSTYPGGIYALMSGTSMAAPHVAGVLALKLSVNSPHLASKDLNLPLSHQGSGIVDALGTVRK